MKKSVLLASSIIILLFLVPHSVAAQDDHVSGFGVDMSSIELSDEIKASVEAFKQTVERDIDIYPSWTELLEKSNNSLIYKDVSMEKAPTALQEIGHRLLRDSTVGKYVPLTSINGHDVGVGVDSSGGAYIIRIVVTEKVDQTPPTPVQEEKPDIEGRISARHDGPEFDG